MSGVYRDAAERLSLSLSPTSLEVGTSIVEIGGAIHGFPVRVTRLASGVEREVLALVHPSLDLGLELTAGPRAADAGERELKWVGRMFGPTDLHARDGELDGVFAVHGDEPARTRTLVETLREPLRVLHRRGGRVVITDAGIRLVRRARNMLEESAEEIEEDVRCAVAVIAQMAIARRHLPIAGPLEPHASSFAELADAMGAPRPEGALLLRGTLHGRPVEVGTRRVSVLRYAFAVTVGWSVPPPLDGIRTLPVAPDMLGGRAPALTERGVHWMFPVGHEPMDWVEAVEHAHGFVTAIEGAFAGRPPYR